jgi:hypothetical protein
MPYWYRYARTVAEAIVVNMIIISAALTPLGRFDTVAMTVIGATITLLNYVQ